MKKVIILVIGILLMLVAGAVLNVFIVMPATVHSIDQAPTLKNVLQPILCQPDEALTSTQIISRDFEGTGYTANFACVNRQGQKRDVNAKVWLYGIAGSLVPFLIGLALVVIAANSLKSSAKKSASMQGFSTLQQSGWNASVSAASEARLNALKSALDAGLITEAQYEAQRQQIHPQGGFPCTNYLHQENMYKGVK